MIHATPPPPGGFTLRVLCVDDNPDQADSEALFLRVLGFQTRACYGGRDAMALAGAFLPDVCLLDMNMPGMGGTSWPPGCAQGPGAVRSCWSR